MHLRWVAIAVGVLAAAVVPCLVYFRGPWAPWIVLAINAVTLAFYLHDKLAAGRGGGRIPELILHLLALCGGAPAALLGQRLFHHKTRKPSFQAAFWLIVAAQLAAAGWGAYVEFSRLGWRADRATAAAAGLFLLLNFASAVLWGRAGRATLREAAARRAVRYALAVLGGALGAAWADGRFSGRAWLPYLAGAAHLAGALVLAWRGLSALP